VDSGDVFLIAATADQACQYVDLSNHSATYSCKTVKRLLSVTFPIRLLIYLLDISQLQRKCFTATVHSKDTPCQTVAIPLDRLNFIATRALLLSDALPPFIDSLACVPPILALGSVRTVKHTDSGLQGPDHCHFKTVSTWSRCQKVDR